MMRIRYAGRIAVGACFALSGFSLWRTFPMGDEGSGQAGPKLVKAR